SERQSGRALLLARRTLRPELGRVARAGGGGPQRAPPEAAMSRRRRDTVEYVQNDIDAALAALTTDELRALVREVLLELDEPTHGRVADALVKRATRSASGWIPTAVDDAEVA